MKRKPITIALFIVLAFTLVLSSVSLAAVSSTTVAQKEAELAALARIRQVEGRMKGWTEDSVVGDPVLYYSPDGEKTAYEYTVYTDEKEVGYIFVSARKDWIPVLECSDGAAPSSYLSKAEENAADNNLLSEEGNVRMLYWGALSYSVQFGSEMQKDNKAIHLPTGVIQNVPSKYELQMDKEIARAEWDKHVILNSLIVRPSKRLTTRSTPTMIDGVPPYHQDNYNGGYGDNGYDAGASFPSCAGSGNDPWSPWDGCSTIAGAMVHGYWDSHGYSSLPSNEDELIDWNHYCMQTTSSGITYPWLIDNGIDDVFTAYGYGDDFDINNDSSPTWGEVTDQVDADQPAVLSFVGGETYPGHSVTLVGYEVLGGYYLYVHNTWDTGDHDIAWGDWSVIQITKVEEN